MKNKSFTPLILKCNVNLMAVHDIITDNELSISLKILEGIEYCINNKLNDLLVCKYTNSLGVDLDYAPIIISRKNFKSIILNQINILEKYNEFEKCAKYMLIYENIKDINVDLKIKKTLEQALLEF